MSVEVPEENRRIVKIVSVEDFAVFGPEDGVDENTTDEEIKVMAKEKFIEWLQMDAVRYLIETETA